MTRRLLVNFAVFGAVTVFLVGYGVYDLLGNPFRNPRTVSAVFPDASGLRENFSVSMDGVVVGVVDDVALEDDGVRVRIALDPGVTVPSDALASIVRASPVGEQRVELTPTRGGTGEAIPDGGEVRVSDEPTPPNVSRVVDALTRFIEHIPADDLATVIEESALALDGRGDDLRRLNVDADRFARSFVANEAAFRRLLASAPPVMDSVSAAGPELRRAIASTAVLASALAERRGDVVALMRSGGDLGAVAGDLVGSQKANLACLISDFADLNRFLGSPDQLADLAAGLRLNREFFGPVDRLAPYGPAADVGLGAPARDDQYWLRVHLILPPAQPPAEQYPTLRDTRATKPGGACESAFGRGVGPAEQADPAPVADGGAVVPAEAQPAEPGSDIGEARPVVHASTAMRVPLAAFGLGLVVLSEWAAGAVLRRRRRRGR